jgi:hypothetical protein
MRTQFWKGLVYCTKPKAIKSREERCNVSNQTHTITTTTTTTTTTNNNNNNNNNNVSYNIFLHFGLNENRIKTLQLHSDRQRFLYMVSLEYKCTTMGDTDGRKL